MSMDTWQQDTVRAAFERCYGLAKAIAGAEPDTLLEKGCKDAMATQTGFRFKYIKKNWKDIVALAEKFTKN